MVRFGVVAALFGLFRLAEPLHHARKLAIGHGAGLGQPPQGLPDDPSVYLREVEMGLFVAQDGPPLGGVVQDDRLDPGLARPEPGDHSEFEPGAPAPPGRVQRVGRLCPLGAVCGRVALKVIPSEAPPGDPDNCVVIGEVIAHQVVECARPARDSGGRRGRAGRRASGAGGRAGAAEGHGDDKGGPELHRNRRSSRSDTMNPNAGHPPDRTERSNHSRARVVSPRTRYQLATP